MQTRFSSEEETVERRYRPETVQKAAALAAKLQQERRETLSEAEVEQLAVEIGIEPQLMRQALAAVAQNEAAAQAQVQNAGPAPVYAGAQVQTDQHRRRVRPALLGALLAPAFFMGMVFWLYAFRSAPAPAMLTPPVPVTATLVPPPAVAAPPVPTFGSAAVRNGGFEQGPVGRILRAGSTEITGWKITGGSATLVKGGVAGSHALRLGPHAVLTQIVPTQPGTRYQVTFSLSGVPGAARMKHYVNVSAQGGTSYTSAFTDVKGTAPAHWTRKTMEFEASEDGTEIEIAVDRTRVDAGSPLIDDVVVTPMP